MSSRHNSANANGDAVQQYDLEAIAVIGISLKFPQDATSPATLWTVLEEKKCAMTDWPKDRINLDAFYHADSDRRDTISVRGGHFLEEDLGVFDASFFSITASEANSMDPQQRMLLETSYRALENAGISLEKAFGSKTGVYTGSMSHDYQMISMKDPEVLPRYTVTGISTNLLANRVSWFFNFRGPSVNLDSACSSSLMALDIACQGLRNGESTMALVAGVNIILAPEIVISLNNMGFLSPDSRCYSFDDRANGYGRGEGCGVVVIKRVSDAIRDGDTIRAIIRSTGSNQDGHTPGITQPSRDAQASLIRETYQKAGMDFTMTRFFEAHGTGTPLGDPIEADAIGSVFRSHRGPKDPLFIGSIKSNIGHLEGGSGVAGLIKTIMVLEKGVIPPNANFERLNSGIDAELLNIKIPSEMTPWPTEGLRRASVNSFGIGGSNSHAVLEDAYNYLRSRGLAANHCTVTSPSGSRFAQNTRSVPSHILLCGSSSEREHSSSLYPPVRADGSRNANLQINGDTTGSEPPGSTHSDKQPLPKLLVWSAPDEGGLARLLADYHIHFTKTSSQNSEEPSYLDSLPYTLAFRRTSFPWRSYAVVQSLSALKDLQPLVSRPVRSTRKLGVGYIFTGQGAQYRRMGMELLSYPVFDETLRSIDSIFRGLGSQWSLFDLLLQPESSSSIDLPQYSQPLCTALQIALVELLRSFNICPSAVVGHSSGEIAAAYTVGGLSLQSACRVSYFRGYVAGELVKATQNPGSMMSVNLSESEIWTYLAKGISENDPPDITVACINSPKNVTISGDEARIASIQTMLEKDQIFCRKLSTGVAYHSPRMQAVTSQYASSIQGLEKGTPVVKDIIMISSMTGKACLKTDELATADYWVKNMILPVKFSHAIAELALKVKGSGTRKLGVATKFAMHDLIEIGPHPTLKRPTTETLATHAPKAEIRYSSVLSRYNSALATIFKLLGDMYSLGYPIALEEVNQIRHHPSMSVLTLTDLPEYPFSRSQRYWHESSLSKNFKLRKYPRLDLLGTPMADSNALEMRWRKFFDVAETPWIEEHRVSGTAIYPAAGMIVMAIEGAKQMSQMNRQIVGYHLKDVAFSHAISIGTAGGNTQAQLYMRPTRTVFEKESTSSEFRICVFENGEWIEACRGSIQTQYEITQNEVDGARQEEQMSRQYRECYDKAVQLCDQPIRKDRMYRHFEAIGLGYGPAFQALERLAWDGKNTAVGEIHSHRWRTDDRQSSNQSHVIHPVTLDAAAQLMWAALTKGATAIIPTAVPTRIREAWIADSGLGYPEPAVLRTWAHSSFKGIRGTECSMFCLDLSGTLKISISSMESTAVSVSHDMATQSSNLRQLCFNMDWKPDPSLLSSRQILDLCGAGSCTSVEPKQFYQDLGLFMFSYIRKTLKEIEIAPPDEMKPHLKKYVDWMKLQVTRYHSGQIPNSDPEWISLSEDYNSIDSLSNKLERTNAQGKLYVTVARRLSSIVRGSIDPLEVLFTASLAEDHYREVCDTISSCRNLWNYLDVLAHKNPGLRILEIGAGTGSMTGHVLSPLLLHGEMENGTARFSKFDYTDVSEAFFEKAKEKFSFARANMAFKTLNIENDPMTQGFSAESYDLVVACNVLHTTRDLGVTLRNTRKLLRPGGKLLLLEITEPETLRSNFAFGTLPGWWCGTEDNRRWSPCLTEAQWDKLLSQNGFSGVDFVLPDYQSQICHEMGLMVSTAVVDTEQPPFPWQTVIIVKSDSHLQMDLACRIRGRLQSLGSFDCEVLCVHDMPKSQGTAKIFIFLSELEQPFLYDLDERSFKWLQELLSLGNKFLWVTSADWTSQLTPKLGMVTGLARVLRTERTNLSFVTLALEDQHKSLDGHVESILKVLQATQSKNVGDIETEYLEQDGTICINRTVEANYLNLEVHNKTSAQLSFQEFHKGPPLALTIASPGFMESLQFTEDPVVPTSLEPNEIEIEVKAVGVNFRDLLVVLGRHDEDSIGCECAGIVTRVGADCTEFQLGDRVCAAVIGCTKTYVRCDHQLAVKVPETFTYTEAAAFPITGVTAYYALVELARLQKGESVLIHCGSGGTGQMAVQLAQSIGAEVFVTVGFEQKKRLLMNTYQVPEDHIFYSRDTNFAAGIMRMTQSRGVDVVLNSLSGDSLLSSWASIAPFGRFIEIGKADIQANAHLPMTHFAKNVSFSALAVDHIVTHRPPLVRKSLSAVVDMLVDGRLKIADPLHIYDISSIEEAFRFLQSGKNSGKIVLSMGATDMVPTLLDSRPSFDLDPSATYLIAGGLGGLGRSAARWMSRRGAKNLILLSRSGPKSEAAFDLLKELKDRGVNVEAPKCDVSCAESLSSVLAQSALPPIKGCLQGTMVLMDALFEEMTFADWSLAVRSKVQSSWNLHAQLPADMDFFVMLSSLAGIVGSIGQSNYAAGNTYQDALAKHRVLTGQRATALDLGWMSEVGIIAENEDLAHSKEIVADMAKISERDFHALLEYYCNPTLKLPMPHKAQAMIGLVTPAQLRSKGLEVPDWLQTPLFSPLAQMEVQGTSSSTASGDPATTDGDTTDYAAEFQRAPSRAEAGEVVVVSLVRKLAKALAITPSDIDTARPLHAYGVDSLLAVELRNWFAKVFAADMAVFEIMGQGSSIGAVGAAVAAKSTIRREELLGAGEKEDGGAAEELGV